MNIRDKMPMWCVSFYEKRHHTNPSASVYVRANGTFHAINEACNQVSAYPALGRFESLSIETAEWKHEEEFCTPWNKPELP